MTRRLEHAEQVEVVRWLRAARICFAAIPNGARTSISVARRLKAEGLEAGAPDLLIFDAPPTAPDLRGVALEMKAPDAGKPSPEQLAWQEKLAARGWKTLVCYGAAEAFEALGKLGYRVPLLKI